MIAGFEMSIVQAKWPKLILAIMLCSTGKLYSQDDRQDQLSASEQDLFTTMMALHHVVENLDEQFELTEQQQIDLDKLRLYFAESW